MCSLEIIFCSNILNYSVGPEVDLREGKSRFFATFFALVLRFLLNDRRPFRPFNGAASNQMSEAQIQSGQIRSAQIRRG